jgi:glycosyl transferase family 4
VGADERLTGALVDFRRAGGRDVSTRATGRAAAMRIAQVAPPWLAVPPDGYGGIERIVDLLARGLHERGHELTLFAPQGSRSPANVVSPLPPAGAAQIGDF